MSDVAIVFAYVFDDYLNHRSLAQHFSDRRRWYKPSEQKEPYTVEMVKALFEKGNAIVVYLR